MNVFISHKKIDEAQALAVYERLRRASIDCFLDSLDPELQVAAREKVTDHIVCKLDECTHLIAVVTLNTETSWWVPFEVGVATEKGRAVATYFPVSRTKLPEFLEFWPCMMSLSDLDSYVRVACSHADGFRESYQRKGLDNRKLQSKIFERALMKEIRR